MVNKAQSCSTDFKERSDFQWKIESPLYLHECFLRRLQVIENILKWNRIWMAKVGIKYKNWKTTINLGSNWTQSYEKTNVN